MLSWLGGAFCIALSPVPNFLQAAQDATAWASLTPAEAEAMAVAYVMHWPTVRAGTWVLF